MSKLKSKGAVKLLLRLPVSLYERIKRQAREEETTATSHMIRLLATHGVMPE